MKVKAQMSEADRDRHDEEVIALTALYKEMLCKWHTGEREEAFQELAACRADYAFRHVLDGMEVDYDEAIEMLENMDDDTVTREDKEKRERVAAALANLIDFSVCEEYQLYDETYELMGDGAIPEDSDEFDYLLGLCGKYNDTYAAVENSDMFYAGAIAAMWMRYSVGDWLVYWTQNDALVRPSHMALQGYAAHKEEFPSWMIPPIDYNCRCYLEELEVPYGKSDLHSVKAVTKDMQPPSCVNEVFKESLATCGRIFSEAHSYFQVKEADMEMLKNIIANIKERYGK